MPTLYIPRLRDKLQLTADWKFPVYFEYRNEALMDHLGYGYGSFEREVWLKKLRENERYHAPKLPVQFTAPAGTVLSVDRIFIRNGAAAFDSITFRTKVKSHRKGRKEVSLRFWVKLEDANGLEFELVEPDPKP